MLCVCPSCLTAALVIYSNDSDLAYHVCNTFTSVFNSDFSDR